MSAHDMSPGVRSAGIRRRRPLAAIAAVTAAIAAGCGTDPVAGGTGVGSPGKPSAVVAMRAGTAPPDTAVPIDLLDSAGLTVRVTGLYISVRYVRLFARRGLDCSGFGARCSVDRFEIPGPWVFDLLSEKAFPAFSVVLIPPGTYNEVHLGMYDRSLSDTLSAAFPGLTGATLLLTGTFEHRGRQRELRIRLRVNDEPEFRSVKSDSIVAGPDSRLRLVVALDVSGWLKGIDLARCIDSGALVPDTAGTVRIEGNPACGEIQDIVDRAIYDHGAVVAEAIP